MVFVELQNTTPGALRVESHFCPSAAYDLLPVPEEKTEVWQQLMGAEEVRRYLFRLVPRPDPHRTAAAAASDAKGNNVGRLEIRWTGRMGECGRLESTDIQHRAVEKQQMEVTNMHLPSEVRLHEPFTLTATLVNTHPERTPLSPYITLSADKMYPLAFTGPSQYFIGTIEYGKAVNIQLNLVALTSGVHVCEVPYTPVPHDHTPPSNKRPNTTKPPHRSLVALRSAMPTRCGPSSHPSPTPMCKQSASGVLRLCVDVHRKNGTDEVR